MRNNRTRPSRRWTWWRRLMACLPWARQCRHCDLLKPCPDHPRGGRRRPSDPTVYTPTRPWEWL